MRSILIRISLLVCTAFAAALFLDGGGIALAQNDIMEVIRRDWERKQQQTVRPTTKAVRVPVKTRRARRASPFSTPRPARTTLAQPRAAVAPTVFVKVIGDTFAEMLADGLVQQFADRPDIGISTLTKASSGLVRSDFFDWGKAVTDLAAGSEKVDAVVIMLGSNDRQQIREGEAAYDLRSQEWRAAYMQRIDAVLAPLKAKGMKVFWIGLPPMKNERMTADIVWFNEIFRDRAEQAGATYVDIWDGFVDADGAYSSAGPDLNGRVTKLRSGDGVHFTKSGSQLAAHYVERDLRRVLGQAPVASTPSATVPLSGFDSGRSAVSGTSVSALGPLTPLTEEEDGEEAAQPEKPEFGPVLPLEQAETSPGGVLLGAGRSQAVGSAPLVGPPLPVSPDPTVPKVFVRGEALPAKEGRADDFRWPKPTDEPVKTSSRPADQGTETP
jgi:uncharacterized protein